MTLEQEKQHQVLVGWGERGKMSWEGLFLGGQKISDDLEIKSLDLFLRLE